MKVRSSGRAAQHGFSLIEVIAVLVVLGILAVSIVAGMDVHASVAVEADILRSHLGYAQSLAMANNTADWGIAFSGASYTLLRDGNPAPVFWPNESSATYALPAGVTIVSGAGVLAFDDWGAPAATHVFTLSDGTEQQQVSVIGFTGLVP
ncbi:MAG: prepilin-type N-terminal cleavage/methylation domain-containing protein [Kiritimatiellia bacterium]